VRVAPAWTKKGDRTTIKMEASKKTIEIVRRVRFLPRAFHSLVFDFNLDAL